MPKQTPEERRAHRRAFYRENRDRILASVRRYQEPRRGQRAVKQRAYRAANLEKVRARARAYGKAHRQRIAEKNRAYRLAHAAEMLAYIQAYRAQHPEQLAEYNRARRARQAAAPRNDLSAAQWREIKEHYGHRCVYCQRKMQKLTQDHIIPLVRGGSHTAQNIVPACRSCNARKSVGPPPIPVQPLLLTLACPAL